MGFTQDAREGLSQEDKEITCHDPARMFIGNMIPNAQSCREILHFSAGFITNRPGGQGHARDDGLL